MDVSGKQVRVFIAVLMAFAFLTGAAGCRKAETATLDSARAFAGQFMAARLGVNSADPVSMLSANGARAYGGTNQPSLKLDESGAVYTYLQIGESTGPAEGNFSFTYRVQQVGREASFAATWDETLKLVATGTVLLVDGCTATSPVEVSEDEQLNVLLKRDGGTSQLFGMADLPDEFAPLGAEPGITLGVGKEGFALFTFAPSLQSMAFVTWGVHGFLGTVDLPGGRPQGIDVHWEGLTIDIRWAPDSRHLAAVIEQPTGNTALSIYKLSPRQRLALGLEAMFSPDQYLLSEPQWQSPSLLAFDVAKPEGGTDSKTGRWQVDIIEKTVSRP